MNYGSGEFWSSAESLAVEKLSLEEEERQKEFSGGCSEFFSDPQACTNISDWWSRSRPSTKVPLTA